MALVYELKQKLDQQDQKLNQLQLLVMKGHNSNTWVDEPEAADMLGLQPRTLRKYVKNGYGPFAGISFRHTNGRSWQYKRGDLERFRELTSSHPNKKATARTVAL